MAGDPKTNEPAEVDVTAADGLHLPHSALDDLKAADAVHSLRSASDDPKAADGSPAVLQEKQAGTRRFPLTSAAHILMRLFGSWFLAEAILLLSHVEPQIANKAYLSGESLRLVLWICVSFLLFTLPHLLAGRDLRLDRFLLAGATLLYGCLVCRHAADTWTAAAVALVGAFVAFFLVRSGEFTFRDEPPRALIGAAVFVFALLFALFVGAVTVNRYLSYSAPNFDFGLFVNMFHNMAKTGLPNITSERDGLLSHFAVHFSPIYYVLLPFYMLFPSPVTLQIGQAVVLAIGVIPAYRIARRAGLGRWGSGAVCLIYLLYPALSGGCMYDLHENCFLAPLVLWTFDYALRGKPIPAFVFALLTMLVKEDAPVYILLLGLWLCLEPFGKDAGARRQKRNRVLLGLFLSLFALLYFLVVTYFMNRNGEGIMAWRYREYSDSDSLVGVIVTVLRNPAIVLANIFQTKKLEYLVQTLLPLLFLPLITAKPARLILLFPYILINLMPSYQYQHSIYFQYSFGSFAFLLTALILGVAERTREQRTAALFAAVYASAMLFFGTTFATRSYYLDIPDVIWARCSRIEAVVSQLPEGASVRSATLLLAHVADRAEVYPLVTKNDAEYALVDLRNGFDREMKAAVNDYDYFRNRGWELVCVEPNAAALFRAPAD